MARPHYISLVRYKPILSSVNFQLYQGGLAPTSAHGWPKLVEEGVLPFQTSVALQRGILNCSSSQLYQDELDPMSAHEYPGSAGVVGMPFRIRPARYKANLKGYNLLLCRGELSL